MTRPQIERSLSSLAALLGETSEAAAGVECLRELAEDSVKRGIAIKVERGVGSGSDVVEESESAVAYCIKRLALAVSMALQNQAAERFQAGVEAGIAYGREPLGDEPDESMGGDHASALESVYGPDNDGEG